MNLLQKILLVTLSSFFMLTTAIAEDYKEGVHYQVVDKGAKQSGDKITVLEFFWYGCPHCYSFEPYMEKWMEKMPAYVDFSRAPAPLNPSWGLHSKVYYAAELMGVVDQIHKPFFKAIHKDKKKLNDELTVIKFIESLGISGKEFGSAMNSFMVDGNIRQASQAARKFKLRGVPVFIINGKYKVNQKMAGNPDNVLKVIDFLINKERQKK